MDYRSEILKLKEEKDAVILAHNYQVDEIQEIADIVGDSLGLSIEASKVKNKVIVFCGVHFMAETAYMLAPDKTVLLPVDHAGCPMADMVTGAKLAEFKKDYPGVPVVCYVNSTAEVKAESDVCCTSGNAVNVIKSIDSDRVIFAPDRNLGHYVSRFTDKEIILWNGYCPIHEKVLPEMITEQKTLHPDATIVVHPECQPAVVDMADAVRSTSGMYDYIRESDAKEFIVGTEEGVRFRMEQENPDKKFYFAYDKFHCKNMKKTGLKELYEALRDMKHSITVDDEMREKGVKCIQRMLDIPRD